MLWFALGILFADQAASPEAYNPYRQEAVLQPYARYHEALAAGDASALLALAEAQRGSFLEYRIMMALAQDEERSATARLGYYRRAHEVMVKDPLAKPAERKFWLDYARVAEAGGLKQEAIFGYAEALPLAEAVSGLKRLETNPYRLANIFLQARQHRQALEALAGRTAPSVEAPALRALGNHEEALEAYERWLDEVPTSETARYGKAWCLFYLGKNSEADAIFAMLPGSSALYGRGLIAKREGDLEAAVGYFKRSGEPRHLWLAGEMLENDDRQAEAIALYLELAKMDSSYADDAAFRAWVLAQRKGDAASAARAQAAMPPSYFALDLGKAVNVPKASNLKRQDHPVLELANALARAFDYEAAMGELRLALREARDEAGAITLAEALYHLGDYRQSQRAAEAWVKSGSQELRTWRLAYPQAYRDIVGEQAAAWNVDPYLIWAVMREESRYYPQAVSVANAHGLMQVIPSTWTYIAELLRETPGNSFDPYDNIRYGSFYLRRLLDMFDEDFELAVASYNGGSGYIGRLYKAPPVNEQREEFLRFIDKDETREYVQKVLLSYHLYRALYEADDL